MIRIRSIIHVDLNSFYASVEAARNPELKGIPMAVAGNEKKRGGVILTASYEARKYGVKAGMCNKDAVKLCPNIVLIPPRMKLYKEYSNKVMNILRQYTYKVEQFSIDEAWLDVSDLVDANKTAEFIAFEIKQRIKFEIGVTVSVGISYCKVLAKLASDIADRDSYFKITNDSLRKDIWKRPVKDLFGVGSKTNEKLKSMNIYTIGDLANYDLMLIKSILKKPGEQIWQYANGFDKSEVNYKKSFPKSIGNSHTAIKDISNEKEAKKMLMLLASQVGFRLRKYKATAGVVAITIKTKDFNVITRQKSLIGSICTTNKIYEEACKLLADNWNKTIYIRLLGISVSNIKYYEEQLSFNHLINDKDFKDELIDNISDKINEKYNKTLITRACILEESKLYKM